MNAGKNSACYKVVIIETERISRIAGINIESGCI